VITGEAREFPESTPAGVSASALVEGPGEGGAKVRVVKQGVPGQGYTAHAGEYQPFRFPHPNPVHLAPTENVTDGSKMEFILLQLYLKLCHIE
jgi:hypothetical protein